jgi:hypothetical protein
MLQITSTAVPSAVFFSREALLEFAEEAVRYEQAVKAYVEDGDDIAFYEKLAAFGFDVAEINRHTDAPGYRIPTGYF